MQKITMVHGDFKGANYFLKNEGWDQSKSSMAAIQSKGDPKGILWRIPQIGTVNIMILPALPLFPLVIKHGDGKSSIDGGF